MLTDKNEVLGLTCLTKDIINAIENKIDNKLTEINEPAKETWSDIAKKHVKWKGCAGNGKNWNWKWIRRGSW